MFRIQVIISPSSCRCTFTSKSDNFTAHVALCKHNLSSTRSSPLAGELENYTMSLRSVYFGEGTSVGSNFVFDEEQRSLTPNTAGMYFIYIDLNFTCTYSCTSGLLSVKLDDKLTCEVNLPSVADSTPVTKKCWAVRRLERQRLFTQMTVPKGGLDNWKLTLKGSGLGMMLMV